MITIQLTGSDWEPSDRNRYYAQRDEDGAFAFGPTELEALQTLLENEENDRQMMQEWARNSDLY